MNKKRSTNIEIQQFFSLQITLQTLSDTNRTYTHRSPSKEQITNFQSYKLAYISDYIICLEKHICRTTALHFLTVDQQMKVKILNILIAVSYTHLDVYKRQSLNRSVGSSAIRIPWQVDCRRAAFSSKEKK